MKLNHNLVIAIQKFGPKFSKGQQTQQVNSNNIAESA